MTEKDLRGANEEQLDIRITLGVFISYVLLILGYTSEYLKGDYDIHNVRLIISITVISCVITVGLFFVRNKFTVVPYHAVIIMDYLAVVTAIVFCGKIPTVCILSLPTMIFISMYGKSNRVLFYSCSCLILTFVHKMIMRSQGLMTPAYEVEYQIIINIQVLTSAFSVIDAIKTNKDSKDLLDSKMLAYRDTLSGVNTRAFLEEMLEQPKKYFINNTVVALGDINDFKKINDNYGHDVGDLCISQFGLVLLDVIYSYPHSYCIRIGGDEFALIIDKGDYKEILQEIELRFKMNEFLRNDRYKCKVAFGVSESTLLRDGWEKCYVEADKNMYEWKSKIKSFEEVK